MTEKPKLTSDKLRQGFYLLALDWVHLHFWLPAVPRGEEGRRSPVREYGHPAQWASDTAAEITDVLSSWHDMMAEHRNERRPPTGSEQTKVVAAWRYLEPRFDQLVDLVEDEAFQEINDLHRTVRNVLQLDYHREAVPIPCPNIDCEGLRTLERCVGIGHDYIACSLCPYTIQENHYPLLVRIALDAVIYEGGTDDYQRLGERTRKALLLVAGRESTTVREVADHLEIHMPQARLILKRLVDYGHIERITDGVFGPEVKRTQHAA